MIKEEKAFKSMRLSLSPRDFFRDWRERSSLVSHLSLEILVNLRWLVILGQSLTVIVCAFYLKLDFDYWSCFALIGISIWLNSILLFTRKKKGAIKEWEVNIQLGFDLIQLAGILWLTGGIENPFCLFLMGPTTVAAASLSRRATFMMVLLSLVATGILCFTSKPLPWRSVEGFYLEELYRLGIGLAVVVGTVFSAVNVSLVAHERRVQQQALAATRNILEREQRLAALGGLAAATAHELGTPLGTISLVAKELLHTTAVDDPIYPDVALLVEQSQRCRDILKRMAKSPEGHDPVYEWLDFPSFCTLVSEPLIKNNKKLITSFYYLNKPVDDLHALKFRRKPEWVHAVAALVENASDFAKESVQIEVRLSLQAMSLQILDDGPGFSEDILKKIGLPYVTTRIYGDDQDHTQGQSHSGMGLGVFISKTLLEQTGATVYFDNEPGQGAKIKAIWRRDRLVDDIKYEKESA